MKKVFSNVEDLKQLKSNDELIEKCNEIIRSLEGFTKNEKYRILTTLYDSFVDTCKEEGVGFIELSRNGVKIDEK